MTNTSDFKIFMRNTIKFLTFGFKMYEQGVCDKPIEGDFKLVDSREMYGLTKREASDLLGVSVRQFDRYVRQGKIQKGRKFRNKTNLFWDENYIRHLSTSLPA